LLITRNIVTKPEYKELDYQSFLKAQEILRAKGELEINIVGTSMLPHFPISGYTAIVKPVPSLESLKRFDIIVFWQNDKLIGHYFWKKNTHFNEDLLTKPLNPIKGIDHPIQFEQILGIIPDKPIGPYLKLKVFLSLIF
jgi:hypothetical protein